MSSCNIILFILLILLLCTIGYYYYDTQYLNSSKDQSTDSKNKRYAKNNQIVENYISPLHSYVESRSKHDNLSVPCPPVGCDITTLKPNVCLEKYCQQTNNQPEPKKQCIPNSYDLHCPRVNIWESPMCNVGL